MALFEYLAISQSGKKIKNLIAADSLEDAKAKIIVKSIAAIRVYEVLQNSIVLSKKEVLSFFEELHSLLSASIPLYESLKIMSDKTHKRKVKLLIYDLGEKTKMGLSLSDAMKKHAKTFDLVQIAMIENSLKTARLEVAIKEIIDILKSSIKLKKKLLAAFTYPLILFSFCLVVLNFLFFVTIPSLLELFEDRTLHPFTKIVFSISKFLTNNIFFVIFFIAFVFVAIFLCITNEKLKKIIFSKILNIPIFKNLNIKIAFIRFSTSFASLLSGGESYVNALGYSILILNHPPLEKEFLYFKERLIEGESLSDLLKQSKLLPQMIPQMIAIAEETSQMSKMLKHISNIYEEEVDKFLSKLTMLLQPILLIFLGLIIGFVVLSVLIPLTDLSSFIGE